MSPTIRVRFTEPQIALVMRAHPNCNLDRLTEISFEFNQAGKIVDCIGTIKNGGNVNHNYAGSGLARLYEAARRRFTVGQTSATILQFPNGMQQQAQTVLNQRATNERAHAVSSLSVNQAMGLTLAHDL